MTMRSFADLSEREILALAISSEEEDGRIYADFAEGFRDNCSASAHVFADMAAEECERRRQLTSLYVEKFGDQIPLIRRRDICGGPRRRPIWQLRLRGVDVARQQARQMEQDAARFYRQATQRAADAAIRGLLGELAAEETRETMVAEIDAPRRRGEMRVDEDDDARRRFILQVVQPGLIGLMDGSVSTLAPLFAAAFATHNSWNAFLVGMAAAIGASISMGFAEALADDGKLSGRGAPLLRGLACGIMTFAGGVGHTLPYLIADFAAATTIACAVVVIELIAIALIQWRFMETPPLAAAAKVMLGGGLVLAAGIMIGNG